MKRTAIAPLLACLLCGCSIFDLKNPSAPSQELVTDDPLNIVDILRAVAPEVTASMDYRDYFASDVVFETQFLDKYYSNDVIRMLDNLRSLSAIVEWDVNKAERVEFLRLRNVPYTVYQNGKQTSAGLADFQIIQEPNYMIKYWKDMPNGTPFFQPW